MELLIGDVIQYKHDDWSYVIREINLDFETDQIYYECVGPKGDTNTYPNVWCHTVDDLLEAVKEGKISFIKRGEPSKNLPKFKFI
jgi:hypothetical protein